jgi:hypothetical protein
MRRAVIAAQANIVSNGVVTAVADAVLLVPSAPGPLVMFRNKDMHSSYSQRKAARGSTRIARRAGR